MTEKYRGYTISYDPPPIPMRNCDWQWQSENFDAWTGGDTDAGEWSSNGLAGSSASLEEAKADIDEQIAESTCEEFASYGEPWLMWESAEDLWRAEPKARCHADDHSVFIEAVSADECRREVHQYQTV